MVQWLMKESDLKDNEGNVSMAGHTNIQGWIFSLRLVSQKAVFKLSNKLWFMKDLEVMCQAADNRRGSAKQCSCLAQSSSSYGTQVLGFASMYTWVEKEIVD